MESTNFKTGTRVTSIKQLYNLAKARKSVFDVNLGLKAARVVMNQQAWTLQKKIDRGGVYTSVRK